MHIRDAIAEFYDALSADRLKDKTVNWYQWMLVGSPASPFKWLEHQKLDRLETISAKHLRRYIVVYSKGKHSTSGKPLSEATINAMIRALHKFFKWCAKEYKTENPMTSIAYPQRQKSSKRIDLKALINSLQKMIVATSGSDRISIRDRAILFLLVDSGIRAGGLVGLQMSDLYLEDSCAVVQEKRDQWRWVVFVSETAAAIRCWMSIRESAATVFYNLHTGEPLTVSGLRSIIRSIARRAEVDQRIYTHLMRKSFISLYTFAGGDVLTASKLAGHADVKTTIDHYVIYNARDLAQKHEQYSPLRFLMK